MERLKEASVSRLNDFKERFDGFMKLVEHKVEEFKRRREELRAWRDTEATYREFETTQALLKDLNEKTPEIIFGTWGDRALEAFINDLRKKELGKTEEPSGADEERAVSIVKSALEKKFLRVFVKKEGWEWRALCEEAGRHGWANLLETILRDREDGIRKEGVELALDKAGDWRGGRGAYLKTFRWGLERGLTTTEQAVICAAHPGGLEYLEGKGFGKDLEMDGWTPVHEVCMTNNGDVLKSLIEKGYPISRVSGGSWEGREMSNSTQYATFGVTYSRMNDLAPLEVAAFMGNLPLTRVLIEAGAVIREGGHESTLNMAVRGQSLALIEELVREGADVHGGDDCPFRETPLAWAIRMSNPSAVQKLVDCGCDLRRYGTEATDFTIDLYGGSSMDTLEVLGRNGALFSSEGTTFLRGPIPDNKAEVAKVLLSAVRAREEREDFDGCAEDASTRIQKRRI